MRPLVILAMLSLSAAQARTQVRDAPARAPQASAVNDDVAALAAGWSALGAGQFDSAARQADVVLGRRSWDLAALTLKITALSAIAPTSGLGAYESWRLKSKHEDIALLEPVAIAVLQQIAKDPDPNRRITALTALVTAHVAGAREALDTATGASPQQKARFAVDADAAKRGDAAAAGRLNAAAANPTGASVDLVQALAEIGSSGEAGLLMLLNAPNPAVRAASIRALGAMRSERAMALLQTLFDGMDPATRVPATIALAQLGDARALARVDQMLASNVPGVQLEAAEAWSGKPGPWVEVIRGLLDNKDGFTRLDAARAIAPVDPDAAKRTLDAALGDANPAVRYESAKSIGMLIDGSPEAADIALLRQRLRDPDPMVRATVANALLKLARVR